MFLMHVHIQQLCVTLSNSYMPIYCVFVRVCIFMKWVNTVQERCTLWASGKGTLLVPESVELEERGRLSVD